MPSTSPSSSQPAPRASQIRVLRQYRIVFNAVKSHFRQVEREVGLGGAQVWALSAIGAAPGIGIKALARALDIQQSTASNLVKGLAERTLLTAARSGSDRRTVALTLTAAGAALLARAPGPYSGVLPEALAQLDDATLTRMETDLTALITLLGADQAGAAVPLAHS